MKEFTEILAPLIQNPELFSVDLKPVMTAGEVQEFVENLPVTPPPEYISLLKACRGFFYRSDLADSCLYDIDFARGLTGVEDIFPVGLELGNDVCDNRWILDLESAQGWQGPVYYASHDAPYVVYQTSTFESFLSDCIVDLKGNNLDNSIRRVHNAIHGSEKELALSEERKAQIFKEYALAVGDGDDVLREFAEELGDEWEFVDLREAVIGEGFNWAPYGANNEIKRFSPHPIWAIKKRSPRESLFSLVRRVLGLR